MFINPQDVRFFLGESLEAYRFERDNGECILAFSKRIVKDCYLYHVSQESFLKLFEKLFKNMYRDNEQFFIDALKERSLFAPVSDDLPE